MSEWCFLTIIIHIKREFFWSVMVCTKHFYLWRKTISPCLFIPIFADICAWRNPSARHARWLDETKYIIAVNEVHYFLLHAFESQVTLEAVIVAPTFKKVCSSNTNMYELIRSFALVPSPGFTERETRSTQNPNLRSIMYFRNLQNLQCWTHEDPHGPMGSEYHSRHKNGMFLIRNQRRLPNKVAC